MKRFLILATLLTMLFAWVVPTEVLAQRRGGSFGGSRGGGFGGRSYGGGSRSFGGSRGYGAPRTYPSRPSASPQRSPGYSAPSQSRNSFGGSRMSRPADYTGRYGVPRRTETRTFSGPNGARNNYVVNQYGGMGDGFMMGYMMGSAPWYWSMPFHPAFYYSRPYTVVNPDGTTGIYPGTFQWGTLLFTLIVIAGVGFILYTWLRNKRRTFAYSASSTYAEADDDGSKSSFM